VLVFPPNWLRGQGAPTLLLRHAKLRTGCFREKGRKESHHSSHTRGWNDGAQSVTWDTQGESDRAKECC